MLKSHLKKVAITGGLSCGKSSVCQIFKELSAYVVSADEIVHWLLQEDSDIGRQVIELFGPEIIADRSIAAFLDRSIIAKKAFQQPKQLQALEKLLHPAVNAEIEKQYHHACSLPTVKLFVAEIPLLFETHAEHYFDATIAVVADTKLCLERFTQATGYNESEYHRRMSRQLSSEDKAAKATYVLYNEGSLLQLRLQAEELFKSLTSTTESQL